MPGSLKIRLGVMMFVNYVVWGAWYVTISTYLTSTLHFSGTQTGAVFGTTALAALISPFFVGLVADRLFATEKVMAVLYGLGYFPTVALTNSITMQSLKDPEHDFPLIRVMGTLGWIFIGLVVGFLKV